jgi:hypothetical protein
VADLAQAIERVKLEWHRQGEFLVVTSYLISSVFVGAYFAFLNFHVWGGYLHKKTLGLLA